ncbi:hypothetical protein THAOC_29757, partial [Thalassiosira oceanica]
LEDCDIDDSVDRRPGQAQPQKPERSQHRRSSNQQKSEVSEE